MEVYIFQKNRRCPYLHYALLIPEITQYADKNLDWNMIEHKVDISFLYKWLQDAKKKQQSYAEGNNETQAIIYKVSVETLQDIICVAESGRNDDWFEIYLTQF